MRTSALLFSFLLLGLLVACSPSSPSDAPEAERPAPVQAQPVDSIGVLEGEAPYMFGRITGVTADGAGRLYVADWQANEIRVFSDEGEHLFTLGGPGEGPGELDNPCCLTFDAEGRLWVRDDQNRRYNRYRLEAGDAHPDGQIGMEHTHFGLQAATTFDSEGRLIDVGGLFDEDRGEQRRARLHLTEDGTREHTQYIPEAPPERIDQHRVEINGGVSTYMAPFGASTLTGHGPGGDWAYALTDRYEVVRFDEAGDTLHVIERSVIGPPLSESEEEWVRDRIRQIADQFDQRPSDISFGVPDRKPPLRRLFFDQAGRLWVQRSVAEDAPNEADVYDSEGTLVQVVQWPSGINVGSGWIGEHALLGIGSTEEGAPQVVRLAY